jgi:hypothetical protein
LASNTAVKASFRATAAKANKRPTTPLTRESLSLIQAAVAEVLFTEGSKP